MHFRKSGPEVGWAIELVEQSWIYRASRVVQAASGAGVFERLAQGPATAADVARDKGLDAGMLDRVLIACAAMGLVARQGPAWRLTPKAEATLVPGAPCYQGSTLAHSAGVWGFWNDLPHVLRGEGGASAFAAEGESRGIRSHRDFILAMHNMAMAGRAAEVADRVDLRGRRTLLDVGGGPGSYAMALCERNPGLAATVMDLPETVAIAREVIAGLGMADRVRAEVGDWNQPAYGSGYDAVLLGNILHGPASQAEMKLAKARRALADGGLLIVQDFLLNAEKTGPLTPALFNVMIGAFSVPELVDRVRAAGFRDIRHEDLPPAQGTTLLTAAKCEP